MTQASASALLGDFTVRTLAGEALPLARLAGQVVLVVNTASACGFTPQLAGLQALHQHYARRGLVVLAFPCNQFGRQERGSAAEIAAFCDSQYGADFLLMEKVEVNGRAAHPLFRWLKAGTPGLLGSRSVKWNFTKFLVGRDGRVLRRYAPATRPAALAGDIEAALAAPPPVRT